jgi:hypothetical protein
MRQPKIKTKIMPRRKFSSEESNFNFSPDDVGGLLGEENDELGERGRADDMAIDTEGTGVDTLDLDEAELFAKIPEAYKEDPHWEDVHDFTLITPDDWEILDTLANLEVELENETRPDDILKEEAESLVQRIREQKAAMQKDDADRSAFYGIIDNHAMGIYNIEHVRKLKERDEE